MGDGGGGGRGGNKGGGGGTIKKMKRPYCSLSRDGDGVGGWGGGGGVLLASVTDVFIWRILYYTL